MRITITDSLQDYNDRLFDLIDEDKLDAKESGLLMTPETFSKVFTPERLKLLRKLKDKGYWSIYELAKDLGKPYEVVFRNVKYLEGIGLITVNDEGRRRVPQLVDDITINLFGETVS